MRGTNDPSAKLYYYSAIYGMLERVFNIHYDEDLIFMWLVFNTTHRMIDQFLAGVVRYTWTLDPQLFQEIDDALAQIGEILSVNGDPYLPLRRLTTIAYSATGNGNYLKEKREQLQT